MNTNIKLLSFIIICTVLMGCAGNAKYDSSKSLSYKNFSVPSDSARIYFKTGIFLQPSNEEMEHFQVSIFKINDQDIGTTHLGQVMVVDIKPGTYKLSWSSKNSTEGYVVNPSEVTLKQGEYIIASSNFKQSGADQGAIAGGILFGLIGNLVGGALGQSSGPTGEFSIGLTDNKKKITVSQFVKPITCPPTFCMND